MSGGRATSYTNPRTHTVYVYHSTNYYVARQRSWGGLYPSDLIALSLIRGDRWYGPNYYTPGTDFCLPDPAGLQPCIPQPLPVGYRLANGQLIAVSHPHPFLHALWVLFKLLLLLLLIGAVVVAIIAWRRSRDSYASGFDR